MAFFLQPARQQVLRIRRGLAPGGGGGGDFGALDANVLARFKPDYLEASFADGAAITGWDDASGQGRHLAPLDAGMPVARAGLLNGRMVAEFGGDILIWNSGSDVDAELTDGVTLVLVYQIFSHSNSPGLFGWTNSIGSSSWGAERLAMHDRSTGGNMLFISGGDSAASSAFYVSSITTNVWHYVIARAPLDGLSAKEVRLDGVWQTDGGGATGASISSLASLFLGGKDGAGFGRFGGYVAESIYLNKKVTDPEVADIESYITSTYGL